jgi:hypothetical protein
MIGTKEHYDMLDMFDKMNKYERLDKEDKELWSKGIIYQDGRVNNLYRSFISGYTFAKHLFNDESIEIEDNNVLDEIRDILIEIRNLIKER